MVLKALTLSTALLATPALAETGDGEVGLVDENFRLVQEVVECVLRTPQRYNLEGEFNELWTVVGETTYIVDFTLNQVSSTLENFSLRRFPDNGGMEPGELIDGEYYEEGTPFALPNQTDSLGTTEFGDPIEVPVTVQLPVDGLPEGSENSPAAYQKALQDYLKHHCAYS